MITDDENDSESNSSWTEKSLKVEKRENADWMSKSLKREIVEDSSKDKKED